MIRRSPHRRIGILALLALFVMFTVAAPIAQAEQSAWWEVRHPSPWQRAFILAVAEAGERIRAYGGGALLESTDGHNWTATPINPDIEIDAVAKGPDGYVAADSSLLYSSTDGVNWTRRLTGDYEVAYMGGQYVAFGDRGIQISDDGVEWTQVYEGLGSYGVAYGDGRYVATAWQVSAVYHSLDGHTWTQHDTLEGPFMSIAYEKNRWVAIYQDSSGLAVSDDGITWKRVAVSVRPDRLMAGNGRFVVQAVKDRQMVLLISADGQTWTEHAAPDPGFFIPKGYRDGYFLAMASSGYYRSRDGIDWSPLSDWNRGAMTNAAYGQGRWVATGQGGTLLTSPDAVTWTDRDLGTTGDLNGVIYAAGRFVAVGEEGIWSSPTGLGWTKVSDGRGFTTVEYGGGRFVALGETDAWYSTDGTAWIKTQAPAGVVHKVAYGNGRFIAVGGTSADGVSTSYAYISEDGTSWSTVPLKANTLLHEVAFNGQTFAAVGTNGFLLTSPDGSAWEELQPYPYNLYNSVINLEGQFVATARDTRTREPLLAFSDDGVQWYIGPAPDNLVLTAWGNERLLALGYRGLIYELMNTDRPAPICEPPLDDVSVYNPACQAVQDLFAAKIVQGRGTQGFVPEGQLSRAEFATMLVRAMGWTAPAGQKMSFSDLKESHWAYQSGAIQAAVANGAFSGFPDGTFKPDQAISRSELVKIAAAVAGLKPEGAAGYADVTATDWFRGWVAAAEAQGLIGAEAGGGLWADPYFHGREAATRNEAALLLWNLMNQGR